VKVSSKNASRQMSREDRKLQAQQLRKNKREEAIDKKRNLGGTSDKSAPFLTTFMTLNADIDLNSAFSIIESCDETAEISKTNQNVVYMKSQKLKQKYTFITAKHGQGNELRNLDNLKVSDSTVFVISAALDEIIDKWGEKFLNIAHAQGIPTPIVALMDLESVAPKRRNQVKADIQKQINKYFPDEKLMVLDKTSDGLNLLRRIGGQKRNILHNKNNRSHLYSDNVEYFNGTLKVTGYLRGIPLSVNGLVHVPGLGTYQMSQIDSAIDPLSSRQDQIIQTIAIANPTLQKSLDSENIPDEMDAEQTFPTDAEIEASMAENKKKLVKKVPKGMSDYQACWIPDVEELDEEDEEDDEESENSYMSCEDDDEKMDKSEGEDKDEDADEEEFEEIEQEPFNRDHKYDEQMDLYEERQAEQKLKAQNTDANFPDEIDTPRDKPARIRFQKYRGLESFKTSVWDVKENLPYDYAKIFQFKDFNRIKRRIIREAAEADGEVMPGMYISIFLSNVSQHDWNNYLTNNENGKLILYGLLDHENKMTVVNVVLKRSPDSTIPIKTKERLLIQCGYRRFYVNPIFSQHTNGNKFKFERFFQPGSTVVASFFAPIQFPPAPVLCMRENPNGSISMIASGSLLSCTPDRIVLKRVVLSGHPFKIFKRSATIRFMFFNKDDIDYFKPCKLRTKCGRIGHIKESLGTHGHMKCVFDGQLKSFDTVFLQLYKRVFPKWTFEEYKGRGNTSSDDVQME
jgi:pre-rRNA-processing protein TSR1